MFEETGVRPVVSNLLYVQQFVHNEEDYLEFFFHITNSEDYLTIDLSKTTHGLEEIEEIDFIDPAGSHIMPVFLKTEPLIEHAASNASVRIIAKL